MPRQRLKVDKAAKEKEPRLWGKHLADTVPCRCKGSHVTTLMCMTADCVRIYGYICTHARYASTGKGSVRKGVSIRGLIRGLIWLRTGALVWLSLGVWGSAFQLGEGTHCLLWAGLNAVAATVAINNRSNTRAVPHLNIVGCCQMMSVFPNCRSNNSHFKSVFKVQGARKEMPAPQQSRADRCLRQKLCTSHAAAKRTPPANPTHSHLLALWTHDFLPTGLQYPRTLQLYTARLRDYCEVNEPKGLHPSAATRVDA